VGCAGGINPPLRRDEFGSTGWTPYRILGPRGPPRLRPLARSGNRLPPALHLRCRGPSDSPPSPSAVRPAAGPLGRCPAEAGCPSASGPGNYRSPESSVGVGTPGARGAPPSFGSPKCMPGRGRPGTTSRAGAPCPFGCYFGAGAPARARPLSCHLRADAASFVSNFVRKRRHRNC
jgi:hypothetical protein